MVQIVEILNSRRKFLFVIFLWILLWIVPWGKLPTVQENLYLAFVTDMLRLGIAIGMFIVPGAFLYFLLKEEDDVLFDLWGVISVGFSFSVLLIGIIGLTGRIAGFSFETVKILFALAGLIELIFWMFLKPNLVVYREYFSDGFQSLIGNAPLLLALVLATLMTFHDNLFFIDDTTYLAYMTNWQHATHLNFYNIVHKVDVIEFEGFWLSMFPMGQALLSDLSGLPGILLLGNYLELFLVPIAGFTSYWLASNLGLSPRAAGFSVLIQISLYSWMIGDDWPVGKWFYESMAEDKVAAVFLLAPVLFVFVQKFIQIPTKRNTILVFLSGVGLVLTHPAILFLSCAIASGIAIFSWIATKKSGRREILQLVIVFSVLMMPYAIIRLYDGPSRGDIPFNAKGASSSFQIDRYTWVVNDVFYGLNPGVLKFFDIQLDPNAYQVFQLFRLFPAILALLAGILAFAKLRKGDPLHWYVLSCVLLVVIATVPYTGWILGYFISARLISRASWFSPLGLGGVLVLISVADWLKTSRIHEKLKKDYGNKMLNGTVAGLLICLMLVLPILVFGNFPRGPSYFMTLDHNKQLAQVGTYIDQNATDPVAIIALDYRDTQMLPGVSANATLISFREEKEYNGHNYFLSIDEIRERINASNTIRSLDPATTPEERCHSLEKFGVRFVLVPSDNVEQYTTIVHDCKRVVEIVYETSDIALFEFK